MSLAEGMDVARVRQIADSLGRNGEQLREVRGVGTASMSVLAVTWEGADVEVFADRWGRSAGQLETAAQALREAQTELLRQADAQESASDGAGGSGGSSGSGAEPFAGVTVTATATAERGWSLPDPLGELQDAWDGLTDGVDDAWDWMGDRADDAWSGITEGAGDAWDWLGDRADDARDAAVDFWEDEVVSRWEAGLAGLERLGPSIDNLVDQLSQPFTEGTWPRFDQVVASAALVGGRIYGTAVNVVTGEDHEILHSGDGTVVSELDVPTSSADDRGRVPTDVNALMNIMGDTYDRDRSGEYDEDDPHADNRHVRVTTVDQGDGSSAYIVTVPGTNGLFDFPGSVTGGDEAFDNTSNLELQAGERSASMEAVEAAMEEAGIPPDPPVMLMGHSQGGMVTAELTEDEAFMGQYNVTHMITQGSPNDGRTIPSGVETLALEHTNDLVPKADLGDAYLGPPVVVPLPGPLPGVPLPATPIPNPDPSLAGSGEHVTQVRMEPGEGVAPYGVPDDMNAHHYDQYALSVERELAAGNPALQDYADDPGLDVFLTDDPGQVDITEYGTARE